MNRSTPRDAADWERAVARAIAVEGIATSAATAARAGRTLWRLAPAFAAGATSLPQARGAAAREGAAARAAFIAALAALARD